MRRVSVPNDHIALIGAGTSALAHTLAATRTYRVTAADISAAALAELHSQLGDLAASVSFVVADVRTIEFDTPVDIWHDRATFHFLTEPADQAAYAARAAGSIRDGGHMVLAGFAIDGPEQCSGLPVARHGVASLEACFFGAFTLLDAGEADHTTPWGSTQRFLHTLWQRTTSTT